MDNSEVPTERIDTPEGEISYEDDFMFWTIRDFYSLPQVKKYSSTSSPVFERMENYWQFRIHLNRGLQQSSAPKHMVLELYPWSNINCLYRILMGVNGGKGHNIERVWHKFLFCDDNLNPMLEFDPNDYMSESGHLTIFCSIYEDKTFFKQPFSLIRPQFETFYRKNEFEKTPRAKSVSKLQADFKKLFLSGKDTDVVLKVEDQVFKAHKLILGMRSPVFAAMFEHDTAERQSGVVNIQDSDPDTFLDFLIYIYAGKVENLTPDKALSLYKTADKYELYELKNECLEHMMSNMTVQNFCDVYSLSVLYGEMELTKAAIQFFMVHGSAIFKTPEWDAFKSTNFYAANELFMRLIDPKRLIDIDGELNNMMEFLQDVKDHIREDHGDS